MRIFATIAATDIHPPTHHFIGLPAELDPDGAPASEMPWPRIVIITERTDGVFLDWYTERGDSSGDTWHLNVDDAKAQAVAEYDGMLSEWQTLSSDLEEEEAISRALAIARKE